MKKRTLSWWLLAGAVAAGSYLVGRWMLEPIEPRRHDDEPAYRGNESSQVFHGRDCRYFAAASASRPFATRAEAVGAGFEPCSLCAP